MAKNSLPHETDKDQDSALMVNGRYQVIPADPAAEFERTTLAAGAVLWRGDVTDMSSIEIAVIHRPHYGDWSLAKGKLDPGESLPAAAFREIQEETGFEVRLGKLLGKVTYPVVDRTKVVYYWNAEVIGGEFAPNDEVDELRWLSIEDAKSLLSYEVDTQVLVKAEKRLRLPATSQVIYVRHARAHKRRNWEGNDNLRPLDKKGRRQAEMLVPMLAPYKPTAIYSAEPDRCQTTAEPLADELNLDVAIDPLFGDEMWLENQVACQTRFMDLVNAGGSPVVVSQGTAIPEMISWLSANGRLPLDDVEAKKASVWMLFFNEGQLTGADYLTSPLPAK